MTSHDEEGSSSEVEYGFYMFQVQSLAFPGRAGDEPCPVALGPVLQAEAHT